MTEQIITQTPVEETATDGVINDANTEAIVDFTEEQLREKLRELDLSQLGQDFDPNDMARVSLNANFDENGVIANIIEDELQPGMAVEIRTLILNDNGFAEIIYPEDGTVSSQKYNPETDTVLWLVLGMEKFGAIQKPGNEFNLVDIGELETSIRNNKALQDANLVPYAMHYFFAADIKRSLLNEEKYVAEFQSNLEKVNKLLGKSGIYYETMFASLLDFSPVGGIPSWDSEECVTIEDGSTTTITYGLHATVTDSEPVATDKWALVFVKLQDHEGKLSEKYHPVIREIHHRSRPETFNNATINYTIEEHLGTDMLGAYIMLEFDSFRREVTSAKLGKTATFDISLIS